jgi:hypothetical protein
MQPDLTEAFEEVLHPSYKAQLDEIVARLDDAEIPFLLAGGIAVGAYGEPRVTKDIDVMLPLDAWTRSGSPILTPPIDATDLPKIDLMVMPETLEALEPIAEDTALVWEGIRVVAPEVLAVMKLEADRLQDHADIAVLLEAGLNEKKIHEVLDQLPTDTENRLRIRLTTIVDRAQRQRKRLKNRLLR